LQKSESSKKEKEK
jgi:hypothetical protein